MSEKELKSVDEAGEQKEGQQTKGSKPFYRKRICRFCTNKTEIDYKDVDLLKRFTTVRGKILPRRVTGNCAKHQRMVAAEVKRARMIALLPFVAR